MQLAAVPPEEMSIAIAPAIRKILKHHGLASADVDLWELHEAYAVTTLYNQAQRQDEEAEDHPDDRQAQQRPRPEPRRLGRWRQVATWPRRRPGREEGQRGRASGIRGSEW